MNGLIYLASPYTHERAEVREQRFVAVCKVAAAMMMKGLHVFSPIAHTHPILIHGNTPGGWEFWVACDRAMLGACEKLIVLRLDGWQQSKGVTAEIEIAAELGMTVEYVDFSDWVAP